MFLIRSTDDAYAYRVCDYDGRWRSNLTDYTECLQILNTVSIFISKDCFKFQTKKLYFLSKKQQKARVCVCLHFIRLNVVISSGGKSIDLLENTFRSAKRKRKERARQT